MDSSPSPAPGAGGRCRGRGRAGAAEAPPAKLPAPRRQRPEPQQQGCCHRKVGMPRQPSARGIRTASQSLPERATSSLCPPSFTLPLPRPAVFLPPSLSNGERREASHKPSLKLKIGVGSRGTLGSYSTEEPRQRWRGWEVPKQIYWCFPVRHQGDLTDTSTGLSQVCWKYFSRAVRLALLLYLRMSEDSIVQQIINRIK